MYFNAAKVIVLVSWMFYAYFATKNKAIKLLLGYIAYFAITTSFFVTVFPGFEFFSLTWQYLAFLLLVGIPFLVVVVKAGNEFDRQRTEGSPQEKISPKMFSANKANFVFGGAAVALLILGKVLDMKLS
jgi:hypothetical protein